MCFDVIMLSTDSFRDYIFLSEKKLIVGLRSKTTKTRSLLASAVANSDSALAPPQTPYNIYCLFYILLKD